MKIRILLLAAALAISAHAQTAVTPNLGMRLPVLGSTSWGPAINANTATLDAAVGALMNAYQGAWNATTHYTKAQDVSYGGNVYMAIINNQNIVPGSDTVTWVNLGASGIPSPAGTNYAPVSNGSNAYTLAQIIVASQIGAQGGVAPLDSTAHLPSALLRTFGPSGPPHAQGAVPDPGASAGSTRFLREDGTWANVAGGGGGSPSGATSSFQINGDGAFAGAGILTDSATRTQISGVSKFFAQQVNGTLNTSQFPNGLTDALAASGAGGLIVQDPLDTTTQRPFYTTNGFQIYGTASLPNFLHLRDVRSGTGHDLNTYLNWGEDTLFGGSNAVSHNCLMNTLFYDYGDAGQGGTRPIQPGGTGGATCLSLDHSSTIDGFNLGGVGEATGGEPGGWMGQTTLNLNTNTWSSGIKSLIGMGYAGTGAGDQNIINLVAHIHCGSIAPGDEGCIGFRDQIYDAPNMTGVVAIGGVGAQALTFNQVAYGNSVGVQTPLIDLDDDVWNCTMAVVNTGRNSAALANLTGCTSNGSPVTFTPSIVASLPSTVIVARIGETATFTSTINVVVTDSSGNTAMGTVSLSVVPSGTAVVRAAPPVTTGGSVSLTTTTLSDAVLDVAYASTIGATGGSGSYTCTLAVGSTFLPGGVRLNSDCSVTGVPNVTIPTHVAVLTSTLIPEGTFTDFGGVHDETVHVHNVDTTLTACNGATPAVCTQNVWADLQFSHEANTPVLAGGLAGRKLDQLTYDTPTAGTGGGINRYLLNVAGSPTSDSILVGAQEAGPNGLEGFRTHSGPVTLYHGCTTLSVKEFGQFFADGQHLLCNDNDAAWSVGSHVNNTALLSSTINLMKFDEYSNDPYAFIGQHNDYLTGYGGVESGGPSWASFQYMPDQSAPGGVDMSKFTATGGAYHGARGIELGGAGPFQYGLMMDTQPVADDLTHHGLVVGFGGLVGGLALCGTPVVQPCLTPQLDVLRQTTFGDALIYDNSTRGWILTGQAPLTLPEGIAVTGGSLTVTNETDLNGKINLAGEAHFKDNVIYLDAPGLTTLQTNNAPLNISLGNGQAMSITTGGHSPLYVDGNYVVQTANTMLWNANDGSGQAILVPQNVFGLSSGIRLGFGAGDVTKIAADTFVQRVGPGILSLNGSNICTAAGGSNCPAPPSYASGSVSVTIPASGCSTFTVPLTGGTITNTNTLFGSYSSDPGSTTLAPQLFYADATDATARVCVDSGLGDGVQGSTSITVTLNVAAR